MDPFPGMGGVQYQQSRAQSASCLDSSTEEAERGEAKLPPPSCALTHSSGAEPVQIPS